MRNQLILPTTAVLSLVGAAFGVHLGNASIAEINPVHFASDDPAPRFHADLTPQGYRDWASVQAAEFRIAQSGTDLGSGCVGCRTYPEEVVPVYEASLGKPHTGWAEVSEVIAPPEPQPAVQEVEPDPAVEQVERYSAFPVTAEEELEQAQEMAQAAPYAELGWSAFD